MGRSKAISQPQSLALINHGSQRGLALAGDRRGTKADHPLPTTLDRYSSWIGGALDPLSLEPELFSLDPRSKAASPHPPLPIKPAAINLLQSLQMESIGGPRILSSHVQLRDDPQPPQERQGGRVWRASGQWQHEDLVSHIRLALTDTFLKPLTKDMGLSLH